MFKVMPFNIKKHEERGREAVEKAVDFLMDQRINPLGKVSGVLSPFRVDVIDEGDHYEIIAELPGFSKEEVAVSYDESNQLLITAEHMESEYEPKYICHERREGKFERAFYIDDIKEDEVNVSLNGGLLRIILPKLNSETKKKTFTID